MKERIKYVDAFRGVAVLYMIVIQLFDAFSVSSIYSTAPYYVESINSVTWFPPPLFFAFVTGMSVFLLLKNLDAGQKNIYSFKKVVYKYGKYIVLVIPFTWIMWGFERFIGWQEAVQGLALGAIVLSGLYLLLRRFIEPQNNTAHVVLIGLIFLFSFLQASLPHITSGVSPIVTDIGSTMITLPYNLVLNALYRGWFSVANLLPVMLGGLIFISLCLKGRTRDTFLFGAAMLLISLIMHFFWIPIDYYGRSASLAIFGIGQAAVLNSLILYAYRTNVANGKISAYIEFVGKKAFLAYILHYILIIKILQVIGLRDSFTDPISWLLAFISVGVISFVLKFVEL